ncbi:MAG TPA: phospholipase, partial [Methylophaga sp.]|nr:phospholipase [Methylophaga sp.]
MDDKKIIRVGENCWRSRNANRAALLVDGENYFGALHTAIMQAQYAVYILAWD